jgi:hypothetical protein
MGHSIRDILQHFLQQRVVGNFDRHVLGPKFSALSVMHNQVTSILIDRTFYVLYRT